MPHQNYFFQNIHGLKILMQLKIQSDLSQWSRVFVHMGVSVIFSVILTPGAHFAKSLWAHNWNLVKKLICFSYYSDDQIRHTIYICLDSSAALRKGKQWHDLVIIFQVLASRIFTRFGIWAHEHLWNVSQLQKFAIPSCKQNKIWHVDKACGWEH